MTVSNIYQSFSRNGNEMYSTMKGKVVEGRLPGSHGTHSPFLSLIGSPLSWSTLMIDIGYMDGTSLETNPIAPSLLSMLAETNSYL